MKNKQPKLTEKDLIDLVERHRLKMRRALHLNYKINGIKKADIQTIQHEFDHKHENLDPQDFYKRICLPRANILTENAIKMIKTTAGDFLTDIKTCCKPKVYHKDKKMYDTAINCAHYLFQKPEDSQINALGEWWIKKLTNRAVKSSVTELLLADVSELKVKVATKELAISGDAPWAYGEMLLSAFETAEKEINQCLKETSRNVIEEFKLYVKTENISS